MKRLLILLLIINTSLFAQKAYEACEATKKEAEASLVSQIVSTMESSFSSETSVTTGAQESTNKESKRTINSTSKLTLSEVSFFEKGNEICAQITQDKLISIAKGKLKAIKHYNLKDMPEDEIALINYLEDHLDQIKQTTAIATLMSSAFDNDELKLLEEKQKLLQAERSKHHAQKVSFQVSPEEVTILIDGIIQHKSHDIYLSAGEHAFTLQLANYAPYQGTFDLKSRQDKTLTIDLAGNKFPTVTFSLKEDAVIEINHKERPANIPLTLAPGEHTYIVKSKDFCPLHGTINAKLGSHQTVGIDMSHQTYPLVTINSNQEFAELTLDGKKSEFGKAQTFRECQEKTISYSVTFDKQTRQGTVDLKPGLMKTLSVDFLTQLDIRALKNQAVSYKDGSRFVFRASYEFDPVSMIVYSFDKINQKGWLRYGFGALYGSQAQKKKADLHYTLALQLTDFGAKEMPLHLGSFALIPFVGIQGGGTWLQNVDQQYNWLAKAILGFDFVLNKSIGFEFSTYKNFAFEKEWSLGIALSLKNPF